MKYDGCTCFRQAQRAGHNGSQYIKACRRFGDAIQEYGWENFKYEVLEEGLTKEEAEIREKYWIEQDNCVWPNGYNLDSGGKRGNKHSEETKQKMKKSAKSRQDHLKPVRRYTKDGQFIKEYSSVREAERETGILHSNISSCCKQRYGCKSAGGYIWRYA